MLRSNHPARARRSRPLLATALGASLLLVACEAATVSPVEAGPVESGAVQAVEFTSFTDLAGSSLNDMAPLDAWRREVPEIQEIEIPRAGGEESQPALFYDSGSSEKRPLLVALHSWTADYRKQFSIPYGAWAKQNDWVMIHPDYRGNFDRPEATMSEGAVQDILDALEWAKKNASVDEDRIYLTGFSGGGMAVLTMVGRHPDLWTAAAAWVPVWDLGEWYSTVRERPDLHYASNIVASCGGKPKEGSEAAEECRKRSPSSYLAQARGHDVKVLVTAGIEDWFVPPAHAIQAYNTLADEGDRLSEAHQRQISDEETVPEELQGEVSNPLIEAAGRKLLLERRSDQVQLWIFDGGHDVIYNAGLDWLARQD